MSVWGSQARKYVFRYFRGSYTPMFAFDRELIAEIAGLWVSSISPVCIVWAWPWTSIIPRCRFIGFSCFVYMQLHIKWICVKTILFCLFSSAFMSAPLILAHFPRVPIGDISTFDVSYLWGLTAVREGEEVRSPPLQPLGAALRCLWRKWEVPPCNTREYADTNITHTHRRRRLQTSEPSPG